MQWVTAALCTPKPGLPGYISTAPSASASLTSPRFLKAGPGSPSSVSSSAAPGLLHKMDTGKGLLATRVLLWVLSISCCGSTLRGLSWPLYQPVVPGYGSAFLSPVSCSLWMLLSPHDFGRYWFNQLMNLYL